MIIGLFTKAAYGLLNCLLGDCMSEEKSVELVVDRIKAMGVRFVRSPILLRARSFLANDDARIAFFVIVCLGLVLRFWVYSAGVSLWMDEAMLALNIQSRSMSELFEPLDYVQFGPIGWILSVDFLHSTIGGLEYSLRLLPLLSGVVAVLCFAHFARREFSIAAALFVTITFALLPRAIEYSAEIKPYGTDILFSVLITIFAYRCLKTGPTKLIDDALLFVVGVLGIAMSLPAAFVVGSAGIAIFVARYQTASGSGMFRIAIISLGWFAAFLALYFGVYAHQLETNASNIQGFFLSTGKLPSLTQGPVRFLTWYPKSVYSLFTYLFERPSSIPAGLIYLVGSWAVLRKSAPLLLLLVLPLVTALAASGFGFYPFENRFYLFYAPQIILLMGYGLQHLIAIEPSRRGVIYAIAIVVSMSSVSKTLDMLSKPKAPFVVEDIKPVLRELQTQIQPGDTIYVYYGAIPAYRVYKEQFGLTDYETIKGLTPYRNWQCYYSDIDEIIDAQRAWLVFSHDRHTDGLSEFAVLEHMLGLEGERVLRFQSKRARLVLFEFQGEARKRDLNWSARFPRPDNWRETCTPYWH